MAAENAQTLVTAAVGQGYPALSERQVMECLLYAVGNGGGGGGGGGGGSGSVEQGDGPPVAPPADPLNPAIYTDLLTTFVYSWFVANQAWIISSTSGGNAISQGHGDPSADPTDPTAPSLYYDIDTGVLWTWVVADQEWV